MEEVEEKIREMKNVADWLTDRVLEVERMVSHRRQALYISAWGEDMRYLLGRLKDMAGEMELILKNRWDDL